MTAARRKLGAQPPLSPRSPLHQWTAACAGQLPAEALSTRDREDLVWQLHRHGWADREIAQHCHMSTYTTARIRARLGLAAQGARHG